MGIKVILFDADGVIQLPARGVEDMLRHVFGFLPENYEPLVHDIVEAEKPCQWGDGEFAARLPAVFERWNLDPDAAPRLIRAWATVAVDADVAQLIGILRNTWPCWLASNQEPSRARHMSERLGYREVFDREFYSCELGVAKPDLEYFRKITRLTGIAPESMLFLDDREGNVAAAKTAGLQAVRFNLRECESAPAELGRLLSRFGVNV